MHTSELLQLISDYQRAVRTTVTGLMKQTGSKNLLADSRSGMFPRKGVLLSPNGTYAFHGIGCRFEVGSRVVDVDFGPDGNFDGFDAWRLHLYANSAFEWNEFTLDKIETGLAELTTAKIVATSPQALFNHLYFFVAD
jgi:hypothetical protein